MVIGIKREYLSNCDFCSNVVNALMTSPDLSNDTLLLLPYSQHWNRASVFWGRKHRTEGDIQVRVKAY